jgi:serine/threonine-protein kinase
VEGPVKLGAPMVGASEWRPGRKVGRYALLAKIATGGMAEIHLARQEGLKGFEKVVVIKKILNSFANDPEFVEMFLDEARIAAQLSHPNIVQIFDLGQEAGSYYIAMEYLAGESLANVVRAGAAARGPLPLTYAARLVANAAEGLAYAHTHRSVTGAPLEIVHRDISPQNLIVTYDGIVKVVDFGIAKAANRVSITEAGKLKGKLSYMSPEQARGDKLDGGADIFSLAVVFYELVTKRRFAPVDDPVKMLAFLTTSITPMPRARAASPHVPAELDSIIARALERDRAKRYPTARAFQFALEEWLRTQDDSPGTAELGSYMQGLFAERIAARRRFLDAARLGQPIPSTEVPAIENDTERSMPGATPVGPAVLPRKLVVSLAVVAGLGLLGGGIWVGSRGGSSPTPPPILTGSILQVDTDPRGATVRLDGVEAGKSPLEISALGVGEHSITAELEGRRSAQRTIHIKKDGDSVSLVLELGAVAPPTPPAPVPIPVLDPPRPVPADPPRPAPKRATGFLTLDSIPWTQVYLDGKKIGDTPLLRVPVPAGTLHLTLRNDEKGIKQKVEVEVAAGKTAVRQLKF